MLRKLLACGLALASVLGATARAQESWGSFKGDLIVQALGDGRKLRLTTPYAFVDAKGKLWSVPTDTIVDGASIPEAFWSFIGGPFEGKYRNASVVHDFYCDTRTETWEDVHMVFYNGMRSAGVDPITAKIMYSAVYNFGPRWLQVNPGDTKKLIAGTPILLKDAKEAIVKFIQDNDPSLSEIKTISDKLSQLENFTQLEQLLEQYANCTPIIANEGGAHESLKRTIILCGMSEASTKRAALRNIRSLNDQLRKLLETQQQNLLPAIDDYISSGSKESWAKVSLWSESVNGLIKVSIKSVLKVDDPKLKDLTPRLDDVYDILNRRGYMITMLRADDPLTPDIMRMWSARYRSLVVRLTERLAELEAYLQSLVE